MSVTSNDNAAWTNTAGLVVAGINRPVTLRFTRGNQWDSFAPGSTGTRRLHVFHTTNNGASWTEHVLDATAGASVDVTVNNGDVIHTRALFGTTSGRGESSFTGSVTNLQTGAQLAAFNVSGVVDADNNWNMGASVTLSNSNLYAMEYVSRPGRAVTAQDSSTFTVAGGSGSWTAAVELQNVTGGNPITNISGSTVSLRITSAVSRYSGGQFRIRITDASGAVSYSQWGNFTLEIEGGA